MIGKPSNAQRDRGRKLQFDTAADTIRVAAPTSLLAAGFDAAIVKKSAVNSATQLCATMAVRIWQQAGKQNAFKQNLSNVPQHRSPSRIGNRIDNTFGSIDHQPTHDWNHYDE
jgi:hypothetical protein